MTMLTRRALLCSGAQGSQVVPRSENRREAPAALAAPAVKHMAATPFSSRLGRRRSPTLRATECCAAAHNAVWTGGTRAGT